MILGEMIESKVENGIEKKALAAKQSGEASSKVLDAKTVARANIISKGTAKIKSLQSINGIAKNVNVSIKNNIQIKEIENKIIKATSLSKFDKLKFAITKLSKLPKRIGEKISSKILAKIASKVGQKMAKLITKMLITSIVLSVTLKGIPFVGPVLGTIYDLVITPLVLMLSLSGMVDNAIMKSADPEGCCPPGSTPLDRIIDPVANDLIIANIPILGDILGFFYPYVCSENGTGRLVYKLTLVLPKYISYSWLSCSQMKWPDYNCRYEGRSPVNGKKLVNSYDWGQYTGLNEIIASPDNYKQIMREMKMNKVVETGTQYIVPPGKKFVYADF